MAKYLISLPSTATAVSDDAHATIDEAKAAGIYVFGDSAFTVLELPSREEAVAWAARIARSRRCAQKLSVIQFDPPSWRMFEAFLGDARLRRPADAP